MNLNWKSREDLIEDILDDMGRARDVDGNIVLDVEVKSYDASRQLDNALATLSMWQPLLVYKTVSATQATKRIGPDHDLGFGVKYVLPEGAATKSTSAQQAIEEFGIPSPVLVGGDAELAVISGLALDLQKRQFSADFHWKEVNGVILLDDVPSGTTEITYIYGAPHEDIQTVPLQWQPWVRRYATALTKKQLGLIRARFSGGVPGAGGSVSLNGSELMSEASQEIERLEEELRSRGVIYPMLVDK